MGQYFSSIKYVNFEDIQIICKNQKPSTIMINTLLLNQQWQGPIPKIDDDDQMVSQSSDFDAILSAYQLI